MQALGKWPDPEYANCTAFLIAKLKGRAD